ncbi:MAG TPA: dephospho-CoA kinase [Thermoplasmatales archaeon]|nr:dephospho-CoA kinase [Thermoplasmatales archaeon]
MIVALTGTPGTGKTTVASFLKRRGYKVVELNSLAKEKGFVQGYDAERDCSIIDLEKLETYLKGNLFTTDTELLLDGHLSHFIKFVDMVVILRCHPRELEKRLREKGWNERKIQENVEAETLDVILCEAVEIHGKEPLFEIDTTHRTPDEVAEIIDGIVCGRYNREEHHIGGVDWSEEILRGDGDGVGHST